MIEFVILKDKFSETEVQSRMHYCNNAFSLYFMFHKNSNVLIIRSFPRTPVKYLFVVGHNYDVCRYILSINDYIENIIIISCRIPKIYLKIFNAKKIFVSNGNDYINYFYNGIHWGFNFNITEDELKLYNTDENDISKKINRIFMRVK